MLPDLVCSPHGPLGVVDGEDGGDEGAGVVDLGRFRLLEGWAGEVNLCEDWALDLDGAFAAFDPGVPVPEPREGLFLALGVALGAWDGPRVVPGADELGDPKETHGAYFDHSLSFRPYLTKAILPLLIRLVSVSRSAKSLTSLVSRSGSNRQYSTQGLLM